MKKIVLIGNPNVGKSVLFGRLTGMYATVSNYPGTTVEVARGHAKVGGTTCEIIDTPGIYSIYPITEEERVTLDIITHEQPHLIIHIIDAKNMERMLPLIFQLQSAGIPLIAVLNMFDEALAKGINVNTNLLAEKLGIPVVATIAITGQGTDQLWRTIEDIGHDAPLSTRSAPELPRYSDELMHRWHARARDISRRTIIREEKKRHGLTRLDKVLISPITGLPVLAAVLYLCLYQFVGVFGAGTVVDVLEGFFTDHINPWLQTLASVYIPYPALRELFVGEYGILTLGIRYAVAIILPIVAFYFFAFAIIEDSGYLPRLGFLLDRAFKKIGLSGRAIIPIVLGFGCVTMATMVTRTLPTRRERFIATLLLALCIPCAAQTGVIMGLLSGTPAVLMAWALVMLVIFVAIGALSARLVPGTKPSFIMEIPPMRVPQPKNVIVKTFARVKWYFKEVVPLFVLASMLIWLGQITGAFKVVVEALAWPLAAMDLPATSAGAFVFGFFRRDYGAAGLYDLHKAGAFTNNQLLIAVVVLTLFLPCITQLVMTIKERGWKSGAGLSLFILLFAFSVGVVLNWTLGVLHIQF